MSRPQITERHVARTYRVHNLRAQDWIVGASGGVVSNGKATIAAGEQVLTPFYAPWDLDPGFPLQFRYLYTADGKTGVKEKLTISVTCNGATTLVDGETLLVDGVPFTVDVGSGASLNPSGVSGGIGITAVSVGVFTYTTPVFVWTGHPNITATVVTAEAAVGADETDIDIVLQYQYGAMNGLPPTQGVDAEPFNTDWSWADDLTAPIGEHTPASSAIIAQKSPIGSLTLPSTTRRDFYLNLRITNAGTTTVSVLAVQVAYVPLIAGVLGAAASIADAWSV